MKNPCNIEILIQVLYFLITYEMVILHVYQFQGCKSKISSKCLDIAVQVWDIEEAWNYVNQGWESFRKNSEEIILFR